VWLLLQSCLVGECFGVVAIQVEIWIGVMRRLLVCGGSLQCCGWYSIVASFLYSCFSCFVQCWATVAIVVVEPRLGDDCQYSACGIVSLC